MSLPEADLFALATAWGDKLRGRASLQVPTHAGRLHPRDEQWLTLELQKLARRSVRLNSRDATCAFLADVREAIDVWHAIACCPGFTGRENPMFWRRVVSYTYRQTHLRQHGCSDEFTFFQSSDVVFPRLRLYFEDRLAYETTDERARDEASHVDTVCRAFFGLDDAMALPSSEYSEAMTRLQPFISRARYARRIPVAMDLPSWDTVHLYPVIVQLLQDLRAAAPGARASRFCIEELSLDDMRFLVEDTNAFESYQQWLRNPGVRITHWWWKSQSMDMDAMVPLSAVLVATGLELSVCSRLQTLLVNRHTLTDQQFGGLCAALPHARTLCHVRFSELSRRHDWAWLAYALFHRKASTSSWRELSVDMNHLDADDLEAMKLVRDIGLVSLPVIVGDISRLSDHGAAAVLLKQHAVISFDDVLGSLTLNQASWFDAVGQRGSQIALVVPGYGLGFADIDAVVKQELVATETAARLTHFRATVMTSTPPEIREWIGLIGSVTLEVVEVIDHIALPVFAVQSILESCPALTSLMLTHDGSLWTQTIPPSFSVWPNLQTLNICSSSTTHAIALLHVLALGKAGPVPRLRQLRLEITPSDDDASGANSVDEASLRQVAFAAGDLVRRVRTITHLNLHGVTPARARGEIQTLTYDEYRRTVLSTLQLEASVLNLRRDSRVALLSVFNHTSRPKLPLLGSDILRLVFAFAGRDVRNVWIEL